MNDVINHHPSLNQMYIGSTDTARGTELDLRLPEGWNDRPPLFPPASRVREETPLLLKGMIRKGIPMGLRCALWLSNVIQAVHPHQEPAYWHEYRTLAKVRALEYAYENLLQQIVDSSNVTDAEEIDRLWQGLAFPNMGRDNVDVLPGMTESGKLAAKRVLIALERCLGLDTSPMIPAIAEILLTTMSESYAFTALREMAHDPIWYFPVSKREHVAWCLTFGDVIKKLHAQTAEYLEDRGVLEVDGLRPVFQDFFLSVLPLDCVLRIMDVYTLEGAKVLYRFGVAILVLFKNYAAEQLITISTCQEWWDALKRWAAHPRFDFDVVMRKAYGVHGRGLRRQMRFPRRYILHRIIRMEETRLLRSGMVDEVREYQPPPLRLLPTPSQADLDEPVKAVLAQPLVLRQLLASWLPITLRLTDLSLLYSTNYHGRSLELFYRRVRRAKNTLLLCEVFDRESQERPTIIGMYASQAWRVSTQVYGDGGCFLFRLQPNPGCWKWTPHAPSHTNLMDKVDLEESDSSVNNHTALLEQFMVGTNKYISMGGNPDGSCGLRLNEDFTKGESSPAVGFDNEPLHGKDKSSVFDVGLVEVYGFVRQIDGRPA